MCRTWRLPIAVSVDEELCYGQKNAVGVVSCRRLGQRRSNGCSEDIVIGHDSSESMRDPRGVAAIYVVFNLLLDRGSFRISLRVRRPRTRCGELSSHQDKSEGRRYRRG
jgi:hypothetical protein